MNRREQNHQVASNVYRSLIGSAARLITTNLVVAEMQTLLVKRAGVETALEFLAHLYRDPTHEVRFVTRELEAQAVDRWLRPFSNLELSLADAVSFEVMYAEGIDRAFAFDRHFEVAGFGVVGVSDHPRKSPSSIPGR